MTGHVDGEQLLTKRQITQGRAATHDPEIPELGGRVRIRPLTDGEIGDLQAMALRGMTVSGTPDPGSRPDKVDMNLERVVSARIEAQRQAVAWGLTVAGGDTWAPSDVRKLAAGAPDRIYAEICGLTGVDPLAEVDDAQTRLADKDDGVVAAARRFRGDGAGPDPGDAAPDGDAAGGHPG